MPYFVYRLTDGRPPEHVESHDEYRAARAAVRSLRAALDASGGVSARMIFAADPEQAQRLLTEKREPRPLGEE